MCECQNKGSALSYGTAPPAEYEPPVREILPPGIKYNGYVLAEFKVMQGAPLYNGRQYPLMLAGEYWYVHPQDVAERPNWWRLVSED